MADAYICAAVRTAGGRRNGRLSGIHANDLGARALDAVVARAGIDPAAIDDVIFGCVTQAGEQAGQVARSCVLASSLPDSVPAVTIDRQCGSSQQAIQFAAQAVMSGTQDIIIAGGVESMSRAPMGSNFLPGSGISPISDSIKDKYGIKGFSQFVGAEMVAKKHGFTRDQTDAFGVESQRRAAAANAAGAFKQEIVPVEIITPEGEIAMHDSDECIRPGTTMEALASLKTMAEGGILTAGTASQICDGASAVLIASADAVKRHGLTPLARIHNLTVTAGDPVIMLEEPLFATDRALQRAGMRMADIDLYEVNEAFASIPMAWLKHTGADPEKLNVNGGAIALGHPLGATGTKLMTTLIYGLKARGKRWGLQTMCEGGGIANVTIIEMA
jgi:acetyl-CoA C-acetyltransferase